MSFLYCAYIQNVNIRQLITFTGIKRQREYFRAKTGGRCEALKTKRGGELVGVRLQVEIRGMNSALSLFLLLLNLQCYNLNEIFEDQQHIKRKYLGGLKFPLYYRVGALKTLKEYLIKIL
jgi:hypothetical protein